MIYSVFNSNLLLICLCNLTINKASLILRLPTLRTIASILMEKLFLHLIKCLWNEDACVLFFSSDVEGFDCTSYIKIMAF